MGEAWDSMSLPTIAVRMTLRAASSPFLDVTMVGQTYNNGSIPFDAAVRYRAVRLPTTVVAGRG